jgi:hypothetical protein
VEFGLRVLCLVDQNNKDVMGFGFVPDDEVCASASYMVECAIISDVYPKQNNPRNDQRSKQVWWGVEWQKSGQLFLYGNFLPVLLHCSSILLSTDL